MLEHMKGGEYFVQDLYGGADPEHRLDVRVVTELAWHNLFIRHLLRRPERRTGRFRPEFTIINCPSFKADPERHGCRTDTVIALNFEKKLILIANTEYAGENKKSVFTLLNYILPEKGVMAMHCSANHANDPGRRRVLRPVGHRQDDAQADADPHADRRRRAWLVRSRHLQLRGRLLRQDDQPPRGGRARDLRHHRNFGTVIENMVYDPETLELDFDDDSLTANTRCAYPLQQIPNASPPGWRAIRRTS
jgi:phosphoenolpyruvate carboxykinase (ATP)